MTVVTVVVTPLTVEVLVLVVDPGICVWFMFGEGMVGQGEGGKGIYVLVGTVLFGQVIWRRMSKGGGRWYRGGRRVGDGRRTRKREVE